MHAARKLAEIAFKAVQTETDSRQLADLLRLTNVVETPSPGNTGFWANDFEQTLDQLAEERRKIEILQKSSKTGFWQLDVLTGEKTYHSFLEKLGFPEKDIEKLNSNIKAHLMDPDDIERSDKQLQEFIKGEIPEYDCELRIRHKNGYWNKVRETAETVEYDEHGNVISVLGVIQGINELSRLKERGQRWTKLFSSAKWGIAMEAVGGKSINIGMSNPAFQKIFGYTPIELKELSFFNLFAPEIRLKIEKDINENQSRIFQMDTESTCIRKDGLKFPALINLNIEKDKFNQVVFSSINVIDITDLKQLQQELMNKSLYDPLVKKVFSRYHMEEQFGIIKNSRHFPASILQMDLDNFKSVNDQLGHAKGDEVLIIFGSILRSVFREEDCVCRSGGDEFTILLPDVDEETAKEYAERIHGNIALYNQQDPDVKISVSIGLATAKESSEWDNALYHSADFNMYEDKKSKNPSVA